MFSNLEGQKRPRLHPAHRVAPTWGESFHSCCDSEKGYASLEGELRYRKFVPKKQKKSKNGDQKFAEIHLSKIAKLDHAEKRDSDAPVPEAGPETPF